MENKKRIGIVLITICLILMSGCTDSFKTEKVLGNKGYTNIETTGYNLFACADGDFYATGFKATNPVGNRETGTLCCGMFFKGCTIRN